MSQAREKARDGLDLAPDTNPLWIGGPPDSYCDLNPHTHTWRGKTSARFSFCLAFLPAIHLPPSSPPAPFIPRRPPPAPFLLSLPPARSVSRMVRLPRAQFRGFAVSLGERTVACVACRSHGAPQKDEGAKAG